MNNHRICAPGASFYNDLPHKAWLHDERKVVPASPLSALGSFRFRQFECSPKNYVSKDYVTWFISDVLAQTRTQSKLKFMINPFSICGICEAVEESSFLWISEVSVRKSFMLSKNKQILRRERNFRKFIQFVNPDRRHSGRGWKM